MVPHNARYCPQQFTGICFNMLRVLRPTLPPEPMFRPYGRSFVRKLPGGRALAATRRVAL